MINITRNPKLYFIPALIVGLTVMFFGCEGPEGTAGADGIDGIDGVDANETCIVCHNETDAIVAKQEQWAASVHATGGHSYYGSRVDCAPCHTSQGFLEVVSTGDDTTFAVISDPAQPKCRTCHKIHNAYDVTDWDLATTTAVVPLFDVTASIDIGNGNLCANCHQARPEDIPAAEPALTDSTDLDSHFGPHHGPQSNILAGISGWEVEGSMTYADISTHTSLNNGCIACHMAEAYGAYAGGHTMKIRYVRSEEPRFYDEGCVDCHVDAENEEVKDFTVEIQALLDALETKLVALNALVADGDEFEPADGKFHDIVAGAVWNYVLVLEDKSMGAHNPKYVKALLTNAKLALDAL